MFKKENKLKRQVEEKKTIGFEYVLERNGRNITLNRHMCNVIKSFGFLKYFFLENACVFNIKKKFLGNCLFFMKSLET